MPLFLIASLISAMTPHPNISIAHLLCDNGRGTAFYIGDGRWVSAHHVVLGAKECRLLGKYTYVNTTDELGEYIILDGPVLPKKPHIDCRGFQLGIRYTAIGFNRYSLSVTEEPVTATTEIVEKSTDDKLGVAFLKMMRLRGTVYHGMSGGPIIDNQGNIVGIINGVYPHDGVLSRELADTSVCRKHSHFLK